MTYQTLIGDAEVSVDATDTSWVVQLNHPPYLAEEFNFSKIQYANLVDVVGKMEVLLRLRVKDAGPFAFMSERAWANYEARGASFDLMIVLNYKREDFPKWWKSFTKIPTALGRIRREMEKS